MNIHGDVMVIASFTERTGVFFCICIIILNLYLDIVFKLCRNNIFVCKATIARVFYFQYLSFLKCQQGKRHSCIPESEEKLFLLTLAIFAITDMKR